MKQILLISPSGKRWIEEGVPFRFLPGEKVAEDKLGNSIIKGSGSNLTSLVTFEGLMVGNLIKKITTGLGIKQCMKCKQRQQRFNKKGIAIQQKLKAMVGL